MTTAQAYLGTPVEPASAAARTVGTDDALQTAVSQGAAGAVCMTLADAQQVEAEAWRIYQSAEAEMEATDMGQRVKRLRSDWSKKHLAVRAMQELGLSHKPLMNEAY